MNKNTARLVASLSKTVEAETKKKTEAMATYSRLAEEADAKAGEAEERMTTAAAADDALAYSKAKEENTEQRNAAEMYRRKLALISKEGLLTAADYMARCKEITDAAETESSEVVKDLKALGSQMGERADEYRETMKTLNQLLDQLAKLKGRPIPEIIQPRGLNGAYVAARWVSTLTE